MILKKIINKSILIVTLVGINFGCSDALDVTPEANWAVEDFYKNEEEIKIALAGIYSRLRSSMGENLLLMDSGTDESYAYKGWLEFSPINLNVHDESTREVRNVWVALYSGINNANQFLKNVNLNDLDENDYNKYVGEVRFLRAFFYFQLTIWWNEVPLRLEPTIDQSSNHLAPSNVEDIYLQIIDDLTFASENLPLSSSGGYIPGHANKMAAHAMLARIYLKAAGFPLRATEINGLEPYQAAKEHCEIIINSGVHSLNPDYRELFLGYIKNNFDLNESIFEAVFANSLNLGVSVGSSLGARNGLLYIPNQRIDTPFCDPEIRPSTVMELVYSEQDDSRISWNIPSISARGNGKILNVPNALSWEYTIGKFRRWEPIFPNDINASNAADPSLVALEPLRPLANFSTGINLPLIRYSDVLLMYAEVINEISGPTAEAIAAIDMVRNRAGLVNLSTAKPDAIAGKEAFFSEIVDERLRELCFEGNRKFDLIRWGLYGEKLEELNASVKFHPNYNPESNTHNAYLRAYTNFNPAKHLSLPYPIQEVIINNLLEQKPEW